MKKRPVDSERALIAHDQALKASLPVVSAFGNPASLLPPQSSARLERHARLSSKCIGFCSTRKIHSTGALFPLSSSTVRCH